MVGDRVHVMIVVSFRAKVRSGDVAFGVAIVTHGGCTSEACRSVSQVRVKVVDILTCIRLAGKRAEVGDSFRVPVVMLVLSR